RPRAEFAVLLLPDLQQAVYFRDGQFAQRDVVFGAVANHAREPVRWPITVDATGLNNVFRRVRPYAGMVVVEDESRIVARITRAADARVAGAQIAIGHVRRQFQRLARD